MVHDLKNNPVNENMWILSCLTSSHSHKTFISSECVCIWLLLQSLVLVGWTDRRTDGCVVAELQLLCIRSKF